MTIVLLHVDICFAPKNAEIGDVRDCSIQRSYGAAPFKATKWLTVVEVYRTTNGKPPETVGKAGVM